jgi:streptogramin lyase
VLDLSSGGAFLGEIGKGDFSDPYGVTVGPSGDLYVADFGADRVREFTPDGKQLGVWGDGANGTVALQKPEAIAVDGRGTIYVTEQTGHLVKFDESGRVLADWGESSALPLSDPSGLALDSQGNSYVTEYLGNRVDKLSSAGQLLATWK